MTLPTAFGFIRQHVETFSDAGRGFVGLRFFGQRPRVERTGNRCLLDHEMGIFGRQATQDRADRSGAFDDLAQVFAGTLRAVVQGQHHILKARRDEIIFQRALVLQIGFRRAAPHFVERRLGDVEVPALDDLRHLSIEEGEEQSSDMRAVDVGVRHDDDLVVAQFLDVEIIAPDARAERRDQRADFIGREHLVETRAFDVENFTSERQHGLIGAVARLFGRATGAVTFDDEDFGFCRIAFLTIGEFAGQARNIECAFAARQFARLAGGFASGGRFHHFTDDDAGVGRMFFKPCRQRFVDEAFDNGTHFRRDELVFGLRGKFRIRHFDRQHAGETFARIVARQGHFLALGDTGVAGVIIDDAGQRRAEARQVRAAVALGNVVGEAQHVLVIAVVPPGCEFDRDPVALCFQINRRADERRFCTVEIAYEFGEAAFIHHVDRARLDTARVGERNARAGIEEGQFAQTMFERAEIEIRFGERQSGRMKGDLGARTRFAIGHLARFAHCLERRHRHTMFKTHLVFLTIAPDAHFEPVGQRVHHRDADAMQTARHFVGILVELTARMKLGHDDFSRRHALALVDIGRDAATIVVDGHGPVGVEANIDDIGVTGQRLVDGVVHDLIDHVMQARTIIGVADIHAGAFAHRVEAFEDLDGIGAVVFRFIGHGRSF